MEWRAAHAATQGVKFLMASEAELGKKFFESIQKRLSKPEALLILKHSDRFNEGYPDNSLNYEGRTCWVEVKKLDGKVRKMQEHYLRRLKNSWLVRLGYAPGTAEEHMERLQREQILDYLEPV